ncbi:hypothetical protein BC936DRAFT_140910 [Jimgerdemannia flammicorona]|uniref:Uncharacterized protein n=1 Tax=Jimgerdemannia flammicorona TaxID=994334 RepID=A0A433A381_9FUNG|nr:hypothetical protein BC936DRAFT_140910 [Jimgerdemannia flammicorona]
MFERPKKKHLCNGKPKNVDRSTRVNDGRYKPTKTSTWLTEKCVTRQYKKTQSILRKNLAFPAYATIMNRMEIP